MLAHGVSSKFSARMTTFSVFAARCDAGACFSVSGSTGAWSVLEILGANDDRLGLAARIDAVAFSEFCSESTSLSVFSARGRAA